MDGRCEKTDRVSPANATYFDLAMHSAVLLGTKRIHRSEPSVASDGMTFGSCEYKEVSFMQHATREASNRPNRVARWALISVAASSVVAAGWFGVRAATPAHPTRSKGDRETIAPASAEELEQMKASIQRLERTSSAMKVALTAPQGHALAPEDEAEPAPETAPAEAENVDPQAEIAKHRDVLRDLDAALATDEGNLAQRHASAAAFREQLDTATQGRAKVVDLECASDFCKAVLEEDTSAQPAMNMSDVIDKTPFLSEEAMFDYETEGARKRTFVYAALEGRSLPFDRGVYPTP